MEYELSKGGAIINFMTRRDIAETIRFIPQASIPAKKISKISGLI